MLTVNFSSAEGEGEMKGKREVILTEGGESKPVQWSLVLVLSLALLLFLADGVTFDIASPIFPTEAQTKQLTQTEVGFISALSAVSELFCSTGMLFFANPSNQKTLLIIGATISAAACICFGCAVFFPDGPIFGLACAMCQIIVGMGCGLTWSTAVPTLAMSFPQYETRLPNLIETSVSVGQLLAPLVATLFYSLGGYYLPFVVAGSFQLLVALMCIFLLKRNRNQIHAVQKIPNPSTQLCKMTLATNIKQFLTSCGVLCLSVPLVGAGTTLGHTSVAISPHLKEQFSVTQDKAGYFFLSNSIAGLIGTLTFGFVCEAGRANTLCVTSTIIGIIGYTSLALSASTISSAQNITTFLLSFTVIGLVIPGSVLPGYFVLESAALKSGLTQISEVKIFVASWINVCVCIGYIIGECLIGGWVYDQAGFVFSCLFQVTLFAIAFVSSLFYISLQKDQHSTLTVVAVSTP